MKRKKAKKVGQIKVSGVGLEGFVNWVDPISSELAKKRENDMSNFATRFVAWMLSHAKWS